MAAKTVHALKPADVIADSIPANAPPPQHQFQPHQHPGHQLNFRHDHDRRRLSVSEKLAEGRGFWRGVFVGVSFGAVAGFSGSVAMMNVWVPQVMNVAQQAWVASSVFGGAPGQEANSGLTVHHTGEAVPAVTAEAPPAKPAR